MSFEFQTDRPTSLLLYADDGSRRFVQLRLVRGAVQLRYRLSPTADRDVVMTIGDGLDDNRWHLVQLLSVDGSQLVLTVDRTLKVEPRADSMSLVKQRGRTVRLTTGTFVGGLPASVRRRPADLAVPTAAFELRLDGTVRDLRLSRCSAEATLAELVAGRGVTEAGDGAKDRCGTVNPCFHGGLCVSTAAGPLCECDRTDFDGMRCSIGQSFTFSTVSHK